RRVSAPREVDRTTRCASSHPRKRLPPEPRTSWSAARSRKPPIPQPKRARFWHRSGRFSSRFSVLGSQFSVLSFQFSVLDSQKNSDDQPGLDCRKCSPGGATEFHPHSLTPLGKSDQALGCLRAPLCTLWFQLFDVTESESPWGVSFRRPCCFFSQPLQVLPLS